MSGAHGLALALGLPSLAGWFILGAVLPEGDGALVLRGVRAASAALLGLGLSSLAAFAWLLGGGALGRAYVVADAGVFAALALAGAAVAPRAARGQARRPPVDRVAVVLLGAALALAAVAFVRAVQQAPHGGWDDWAIWNLRARFLLRGGAGWREAFSPDLAWSQPGHPLLVPLVVARAWAYAGESTAAPATIAGLFALAIPLAVGGAVARRAGTRAGAVAALLVLATPQLVEVGAAQYADAAVAAFLVAGLAALLEASTAAEGRGRAGALALAGLLLGLGGWSKNEGLAAAACALLAYVAVGPGRLARRLADLAPVALGAALPAAAWVAFHALLEPRIAPALAGAAGRAGLGRLLSAGRLSTVAAALWARLPGRDLAAPAALASAALLGVRPSALARSVPLVAAALLLAVDVAVYLATPQDLAWHLGTSAGRVLFQAWPALLLGLLAPAREGGGAPR